MSGKDDEAAELKHAEEVGFLMFPAADESAEVMQPSEGALDLPAATVKTQFATVLGVLPAAIVLVGAMSRMRCFCSKRRSSGSQS